jgi:hypothetical protein
LLSDFARYLTVLVSGYLEKSVVALAIECCRQQASPTILKYATSRLASVRNLKMQRIFELLGSFDPSWRTNVEGSVDDELKDAVNSVIGLRNRIAHGEYVDITYARIEDYYERVKVVVGLVADTFSPTPIIVTPT